MDRRNFIKISGLGTAALALGISSNINPRILEAIEILKQRSNSFVDWNSVLEFMLYLESQPNVSLAINPLPGFLSEVHSSAAGLSTKPPYIPLCAKSAAWPWINYQTLITKNFKRANPLDHLCFYLYQFNTFSYQKHSYILNQGKEFLEGQSYVRYSQLFCSKEHYFPAPFHKNDLGLYKVF